MPGEEDQETNLDSDDSLHLNKLAVLGTERLVNVMDIFHCSLC